jgi:hypothetical protein
LLQVFSNDILQQEMDVNAQEVTIGRNRKNLICINHPEISGFHAKIIQLDSHFHLLDLNSTNGSYVNDIAVEKKLLEENDMIGVGPFKIKLINSNTQEFTTFDLSTNTKEPCNDDTISVKPVNNSKTSKATAKITLFSNGGYKEDYLIEKPMFKIGSDIESDICIGGMLMPKIAAAINLRNGDYYLIPQKWGKIKIDGIKVDAIKKLRNADALEVNKFAMKFYLL